MSTNTTTTNLGTAAAAGEGSAKGDVETKTTETKPDPKVEAQGSGKNEVAEKAAAEKAAAEAAAKPFTDIAQLKLGDGQKLDETVAKEFLALAKAEGLTAKQAQALLEYSQKGAGAAQKATEEKRDATAKAAVEALKAHKEIGGANFEKSMQAAGKVLAKFGDADITKALQELRLEDGSMLGDNVHIARLLVNVGKAMAEDSKSGTHSNGAAAKAKPLASQLYPKSPGLT